MSKYRVVFRRICGYTETVLRVEVQALDEVQAIKKAKNYIEERGHDSTETTWKIFPRKVS